MAYLPYKKKYFKIEKEFTEEKKIGKEKKVRKSSSYYERVFPEVEGVDKSQLQITDVGMYSVTQKNEAKEILDIIKNYYSKLNTLTITDATAGVGGDTINFALNFKFVHAVEFSPIHCQIVKHNVNVYHLKNIKIYCGNYLEIMKKIEQDIIYLDPPWGGMDYKEKKNLPLFLGKKRIENVIEDLLKNAKMFVVKVPFNFDLEHFQKTLRDKKIETYQLKKFNIVIVI